MVNFVGAGCGSPDLITLRGHRLISEADVIIYAGSLLILNFLTSPERTAKFITALI